MCAMARLCKKVWWKTSKTKTPWRLLKSKFKMFSYFKFEHRFKRYAHIVASHTAKKEDAIMANSTMSSDIQKLVNSFTAHVGVSEKLLFSWKLQISEIVAFFWDVRRTLYAHPILFVRYFDEINLAMQLITLVHILWRTLMHQRIGFTSYFYVFFFYIFFRASAILRWFSANWRQFREATTWTCLSLLFASFALKIYVREYCIRIIKCMAITWIECTIGARMSPIWTQNRAISSIKKNHFECYSVWDVRYYICYWIDLVSVNTRMERWMVYTMLVCILLRHNWVSHCKFDIFPSWTTCFRPS